MGRTFDILIAGGGLSGGLIALTLRRLRPELQVGVVERGPSIGGNHLWSFFESDIAPDHRAILEPLIAMRWDDGYDVAFPEYRRMLRTPYRTIASENLDTAVRDALGPDAVVTRADIASLDADGATLASQERIGARGVIDARGLKRGDLGALNGGWQKFAGRMLTLREPHGVTRPVVMDADVAQHDGYRFVYLLPFSDREIFVEDTYYSDTPDLDRDALTARIDAYAARRGWSIETIAREETGVLPVVAGGNFDAFVGRRAGDVGMAGVRAGLFQPLTSYSLPDAVRFAHHVAALPSLDSASLAAASRDYAMRHWRRGRFHRMLTAMLFDAAEPGARYKVLQRFYTLDEGLIERFYAGRGTGRDALRILSGKPPVPIRRALATLSGMRGPAPLSMPTENIQ
ncbi:lycopene beta-cyclase CrtY [Croceicoccus hydrothermalis]|uniref:lycopene beta-cyclase CrtY n=1 Tax=Croceicoccus hydrothermalis TaxID=2867964 RepID=UPI001EFAF1CF|nr:lycopene beta-cyclase CrtY [Croceicoccus hydrothermalis]